MKIATRFLLSNPSVMAKIPASILWVLGLKPDISNKLLYVFGQAIGSSHNVSRSMQMYNQLKRIGIVNNSYWRNYLSQKIIEMYYNTGNAYVQTNGRIAKEAILSGPGGNIKIQTIWEGVRLITINLFG